MTEKLFDFIRKCQTAYHTVNTAAEELTGLGFEALDESEAWNINKGGKYFVTRNSSSIIAFYIGKECSIPTFRIAASHGDSPCFKIKENGQIEVKDHYIQLNTEGYGGMICYSWMDRPLSIAGRVMVRDDSGKIKERLVNIDRDLVLIPSMAIHMNRDVNKGVEFNKQVDMLPLFGECPSENKDDQAVKALIAGQLDVDPEDILGQDLYVYNRAAGTVWGAEKEYISAPRLDDLMCAFSSLKGFEKAVNDSVITVYACFDNEEVGSDTRQGAGSSFLQDTLERISEKLGFGREEYLRGLAGSFMLSEDNGHAVHPAHPAKTDATNCVYMNGGIVVKSHAGQKYSSDAVGVAMCRDICSKENIPVQFFANRSDEAGGSTLGNIAACRVPIRTVDIGLAQLAMHSAFETAGVKDTEYMTAFTHAFYEYEGDCR